jgi:hypothetical protein
MWDGSSPRSGGAVARAFVEAVGAEVVLEFGESPHSLLILNQLGSCLEDVLAEETQSLQEVSQDEVNEGDLISSRELSSSDECVQLAEAGLGGLSVLLASLVESVILVVLSIDEPNIGTVEIPGDSVDRGDLHLLISIPAQKLGLPSLVTDVDDDGITLSDDLVTVAEVGESHCGVFGNKCRLVSLEPLVSVSVALLSVGEPSELKDLAESFGESADGPITKHKSFTLHKIFQII